MASVIKMLSDKGSITPPSFAKETHYEVIMGSVAYGVSNDMSDVDIYSMCIPPKNIVFPHIAGYIDGFGSKPQGFEQYMKHHISDPNGEKKDYDVVIYNIVKYFDLCMGCNPNMIDSLFVPERCVIHATEIGRHLRTNRKLFLSKKAHHSFKGYAFSQLHKIDVKMKGAKNLHDFEKKHGTDSSKYDHSQKATFDMLMDNYEAIESHRKSRVRDMGFDSKFLYHVRRLLVESEQIMTTGDVDLEADREALKAIRRGDVSPADVMEWFASKEKQLDEVYNTSTAVPHKPDEEAIKNVLIDCLEIHYGNLSDILVRSDSTYRDVIMQIKKVMQDGGMI